ncbi:HNH endonuclease signature motif containing protein, partial [Arthrobacter sp. YAF34]|uniref:HNH endonuclease signature motif containing protein n=1 Tax=Arthrobacter sp. YAF34 TaxID=3233083 RepID=UPI003F8E3F56
IGRTRYRLTTALRQWLRLRDGRCPFPGCNNPSLDNDADHLLAWADGGTTGITNLAQPCRKHHRLKHSSAWTPTEASKNHPPGWISPTGRHYRSEHQDWGPPHWPDHLLITGADPDLDAPPDPGPHPDLPPPQDPFPDWYEFTAAHPMPAEDWDYPGWPATLTDPIPELHPDPMCQHEHAPAGAL